MEKYFTIEELCRSDVAAREMIANVPTATERRNLEALVHRVLDPVREAWGSPIRVNSGYRCPALNARVGGAASSQHMSGEAADITAGSPGRNRELFDLIQRMQRAGAVEFDQLIDEKNYSWVHISYREGANRNQVLHLK